MIRQSPSIKFLVIALNEFHQATPQVIKDSLNPHFGNKFASGGTIAKTVGPYLQKVGLVLTQFPCCMEDGSPGLDTMLMHTSGEWQACASPLVMDKNNSQGQGSGITYLRRYAACGILNIWADEDDDATAASAPSSPVRAVAADSYDPRSVRDVKPLETFKPEPVSPSNGEVMTLKQLGYLKSLIDKGGFADADLQALVNTHAPPWPGDIKSLTKKQAGDLITVLKE